MIDVKMTVRYEVRQVYGKDLRYPVGGEAELFCAIAGTKTLSDGVMRTLEFFGIDTQRVLSREVQRGS